MVNGAAITAAGTVAGEGRSADGERTTVTEDRAAVAEGNVAAGQGNVVDGQSAVGDFEEAEEWRDIADGARDRCPVATDGDRYLDDGVRIRTVIGDRQRVGDGRQNNRVTRAVGAYVCAASLVGARVGG
jgi:hypothetical protein